MHVTYVQGFSDLHVNPLAILSVICMAASYMCRSAPNDTCDAQTHPIPDLTLAAILGGAPRRHEVGRDNCQVCCSVVFSRGCRVDVSKHCLLTVGRQPTASFVRPTAQERVKRANVLVVVFCVPPYRTGHPCILPPPTRPLPSIIGRLTAFLAA